MGPPDTGHPTAPATSAATDWVVVVPVKQGDVAKSRLRGLGPRRGDLARAMAADVVAAAHACPLVREVVVVTDDETVAAAARALEAVVINDEPRSGLGPALRHGATVARSRHPGCALAAISADLPALRTTELTKTLQLAAAHNVSFVADTQRTGTTVLTAGPGYRLDPRFGPDSARSHRAAGAVELTDPALVTIRRDVDTEADLVAAVRLGVGPRTAQSLTAMSAGSAGGASP